MKLDIFYIKSHHNIQLIRTKAYLLGLENGLEQVFDLECCFSKWIQYINANHKDLIDEDFKDLENKHKQFHFCLQRIDNLFKQKKLQEIKEELDKAKMLFSLISTLLNKMKDEFPKELIY